MITRKFYVNLCHEISLGVAFENFFKQTYIRICLYVHNVVTAIMMSTAAT